MKNIQPISQEALDQVAGLVSEVAPVSSTVPADNLKDAVLAASGVIKLDKLELDHMNLLEK